MINKLFNCLKNRLNNFILGDKFYLCNDVPLAKILHMINGRII